MLIWINYFLLCKRAKHTFTHGLGEHFGISIVEAMSAGLMPIVPNIGWQTEFVPPKYQYGMLKYDLKLHSSVFSVPYSERIQVSNSVKFSTLNYKRRFQQITMSYLYKIS